MGKPQQFYSIDRLKDALAAATTASGMSKTYAAHQLSLAIAASGVQLSKLAIAGTPGDDKYVRYNEATSQLEWVGFFDALPVVWAGIGQFATMGYTSGGYANSAQDQTAIDRVAMATSTITSGWGTMFLGKGVGAGASSLTQGFIMGGAIGNMNNMEKHTFANGGQAVTHGTMTIGRGWSCGSQSDVQGFINAGGTNSNSGVTDVTKQTFSTASSEATHGQMSVARSSTAGCSSRYQGYVINGRTNPNTAGNNTSVYKYDFSNGANQSLHGNLSTARYESVGASSDVQAFASGGEISSTTAIIEKINFANDAAASNHGNMVGGRYVAAGASGPISALTIGGSISSAIDQFAYATVSSSVTHGTLSVGRQNAVGTQG